MTSEGEVKGLDKYRFGNDGSIDIIQGSVNEIAAGKDVSWGHFATREDFPNYIKVLEE